jgi:hypothetical protein
MFHRIKEGGRMKVGLNLMLDGNGSVYGLGLRLFDRVFGVVDWAYRRVWIRLSLERDHKMYRPNDVDGPAMICRRCHKYNHEAPNVCRGKAFMWGWAS